MRNKKEPKQSRRKTIKRFYALLKRDLNISEIERLIKRDVPGVYDFYVRDMEKPDQKYNTLLRSFVFARNFFLAFLLKLTAARRLFYLISLLLFTYGAFTGQSSWIFLSFLIINILLALEVADKLVAKDELELARDIQMSLMPKNAPADPSYDIACFSESASEVGGDYYDFIRSNEKNSDTYIIVGDVSGKGMSAALFMVRVQALLQYLVLHYESPKEILVELNKNIKRILRHDFFISLTVARIIDRDQITFCRAGHMPLIHYKAQNKRIQNIEPNGMAVGLENKGKFEECIEEIGIQPVKNDILVFYTDGLIETRNNEGLEYSESALLKVIQQNAHRSAEEIKNAIVSDVLNFCGTASPHDDLTFVIIKRK
jgi:sigma-B regulation protein RsbU (phosphoserine phosphatase)